jgi:GTP-binding protein
MKPVVAILGRPNVGKSTLFNRLTGRRSALVDPTPGVTRDRREGDAFLGRLRFTVVDTAGLEDAPASAVETEMQEQSRRALAEADVALLLFDARAGITPLDRHFADLMRKSKTPVVLVGNKCEARAADPGLLEAYELGMGQPIPIASEHGIGMSDLEDAIDEALRRISWSDPEAWVDATRDERRRRRRGRDADEAEEPESDEDEEEEDEGGPLRLAIVGRPNVGKSTLVNRLLGDQRVITGPEPGITRDAISVSWEWEGLPIKLIDTAGMRRKARVDDKVEKLSVGDTLEAIRFAHVVVVVVDANEMPERQDLVIARHVIDEGRAIVIAVNKWDAVEDREDALHKLRDRMEISLPQIRGVPVVTMSALTGRGVDRLMPAVAEVYEVWNRRVPTGPLNRWLQDTVDRHPPPIFRGRRIRVRYITQSKARPPTFAVFASQPLGIPEAYVRYLVNGIRETFEFPGVPIRINLRRQRNPFAPGEGGD